jgi:hypothetical protein
MSSEMVPLGTVRKGKVGCLKNGAAVLEHHGRAVASLIRGQESVGIETSINNWGVLYVHAKMTQ